MDAETRTDGVTRADPCVSQLDNVARSGTQTSRVPTTPEYQSERSHKFVLPCVGVRSSVVAAEALALLFSCSIWPQRSRELV